MRSKVIVQQVHARTYRAPIRLMASLELSIEDNIGWPVPLKLPNHFLLNIRSVLQKWIECDHFIAGSRCAAKYVVMSFAKTRS